MFAWLQKNVLIPSCFLPLSSPQCPPATELGDACLGLDMLCFKFPGNLALALPRGRVLPASQAPGLCHGGQRAGSSLMLCHGSAVPAENNHQPPRVEMQAHSLTGGQLAALHAPDCKFVLALVRQPCAQHWQESRSKLLPMGSQWAAGCMLHPSPGDASTQCWQQQAGDVEAGAGPSFLQKETLTQAGMQGHAGAPAASCRHLSHSRIQARCGDGVRRVPSSPFSLCPGTLAQGPRDEFTWSFPPA